MIEFMPAGIFFIATILSIFISVSFSKGARERYKCLKWADGKKHLFFILIFVLYLFAYILQVVFDSGKSEILNKKIELLEGLNRDLLGKVKDMKAEIEHTRKANALSGELKSIKQNVNEELKVLLGSNEFSHPLSWLKQGVYFRPCGFFGPSSVYTKIQDGKILLKARVSSIDGSVIADIIDNQWDINSNNGHYFKRNYDDEAIEVITSDGIPVLQIELIDKSTIRIGGVFLGERCSEVIGRGFLAKFCDKKDRESNIKEAAKRIKKIFKYPSDLNLGVRE